VRGRTLGSDYEKGAIDYEHERHQEQQRESEYADGIKVNWDVLPLLEVNMILLSIFINTLCYNSK